MLGSLSIDHKKTSSWTTDYRSTVWWFDSAISVHRVHLIRSSFIFLFFCFLILFEFGALRASNPKKKKNKNKMCAKTKRLELDGVLLVSTTYVIAIVYLADPVVIGSCSQQCNCQKTAAKRYPILHIERACIWFFFLFYFFNKNDVERRENIEHVWMNKLNPRKSNRINLLFIQIAKTMGQWNKKMMNNTAHQHNNNKNTRNEMNRNKITAISCSI